MAAVFTEGFEGGTNGAALSAANTDYDSVTGTGLTFTNASASEGTLAAQCAAAGAAVYGQRDHAGIAFGWYVWRVRLTALPGAITYIGSMFVGTTKIADVRINTDGTVTVRDNVTASVTSSVALTTGAWHRIAVRVTPGGGATGLQLKIYLGDGDVAPDFDDDGPITATGSLTRLRHGVVTSSTFTYLFDEIEVDDAVEPDGYAPPSSTVLFTEDFEDGTSGTAATTSNTGADLILGTAPIFTTVHHGGALGMEINASLTTSALNYPHDPVPAGWYVWRVYIPDLPATAAYIFSALTATTKVADLRLNADGTLSVRDGSSVTITSTVALTTDAWHRIALYVEPGVELQLKVYLDDAVDADFAQTQPSSIIGTLERARFGLVASGTINYIIDTADADSADEPDGGEPPVEPVEDDLIVEMFEGGLAGVTLSTSNTTADGVTGTPVFSTTAVEAGLAAEFETASSTEYIQFDHDAAPSPWYSFYMMVEALPPSAIYIGIWRTGGGVTKIADLRLDTNGALVLRDNVSVAVTSTALLTVGHWHRVSIRITPGSQLQMRVYLGPNRHNPSPSFEGTGGSSVSGDVDWFRIGITTTSTWKLHADRVLANTAAEPPGLPPVTSPVVYYEDPSLGWVDVSNQIYYEHETRGWELIDLNY